MYNLIFIKKLLKYVGSYDNMIIQKESTHSKVDAPEMWFNVLTNAAHSVCRWVGILFSLAVSLIEKGKQRN